MTKQVISFDLLAQLVPHKALIDAVNAAMPAILTDAEREAGKAEKAEASAKLSEAVRDFVIATADLTDEEAAFILRTGLKMVGRPEGTAKNYGNAVIGFRKLERGDKALPEREGVASWTDCTMRDAQDAQRTDEQVKLDEARKALAPFVKEGKLAELAAMLEFAKGIEGLASRVAAKQAKRAAGKPVADSSSHGEQQSKAA